jgi:TRAP-type C4-dicarboxylate transport system permease small subunit
MILLQKGVVLVLITAFSMLFAWYGVEYTKFGAIQHSVMMRANLATTFVSVPIAGAVWTIFSLYRLSELIRAYRATSGEPA